MDQTAPHLAALVALSDHGGRMTEAATSLGVPQSSMSRRIHALEEMLDVPLLVRDGRVVRLTPAAVRLAELSRGPLGDLDEAVAEVTGAADPEAGIVRFGFPLTMGGGAVPEMLAAFARRHPRVRLRLRQAHGRALIDDLTAGALDVAITIPAPESLTHVVVGEQRIYAALSDRHPLATRLAIELGELDGEPFIANPASFHLRRATEKWCRAAGFDPDVTVEVSEFDAIRDFVGRDMGVALLPRAARPVPGLVEVALRGDDLVRSIALVTAGEKLTPVARRLHEFARDWTYPG
ncbi:MAG: LysR family transcriptional regulator [Gordonia sp. (in: high G+C Gram-positive bacteria)]